MRHSAPVVEVHLGVIDQLQ
jgi:hypothetical protein